MKNKKLAVIADIHSNHIAFEAALKLVDELKPDGIIFLGDYISDCPYPQITMELLYSCRSKYRCWFVRGNREEYMLAHRDTPDDGWCRSSSTGSLLYTYENLTAEDIRFFRQMPICTDIELPGCPVITACHGSPDSTREWIKDNDELISNYASRIRGEVLLCGHVHQSGMCTVGGKSVIFSPSVGLPTYDQETAITVLELVDGMWRHEFIDIDYDKDRLIDEFYKSGLVEWSTYWSLGNMKQIREGRDWSTECVDLARQKAVDDNCYDRNIPEEYWEQAAKELGII